MLYSAANQPGFEKQRNTKSVSPQASLSATRPRPNQQGDCRVDVGQWAGEDVIACPELSYDLSRFGRDDNDRL